MIIKSKTTLSYVGDMNIQRDNVVEARRPDIMVVNKKKKKTEKCKKKSGHCYTKRLLDT